MAESHDKNPQVSLLGSVYEGLKAGNHTQTSLKRYYNLTLGDEVTKTEVVHRLPYLVKQRGKGYRPNQTKDYSTNRLTSPRHYVFS